VGKDQALVVGVDEALGMLVVVMVWWWRSLEPTRRHREHGLMLVVAGKDGVQGKRSTHP
jgi:hypothetical protein